MLTLERELESLRPSLGDKATDALIARERREVFSVALEVRLAAWAGAMLLATAAGIVLKNHLERIGPLALAVMIGAAAAACYACVWWRRARASLVDDYVLLLGALLLSADVAFIETQFKLLERSWPRHLLILAAAHGIGAYAYRSRTLLGLSIAALAAWMGIEQRTLFAGDQDITLPAFICAAIVLLWRFVHQNARGAPEFLRVFEHFAANLALCGALSFFDEEETRALACLIAVALATLVVYWGFRRRAQSFVLYGFVYGVIAIDLYLIMLVNEVVPALIIVLASMIAGVSVLAALHRALREERG